MGVGQWLKNQAAAIAFSMSNIEKNALGQTGDNLEKNINQEQRHNQGSLMDSLVNGVITAEVEALRWRTYKVLEAAQIWTTEIVGYDKKGKPIIKHVEFDKTKVLSNIKQDPFDEYKLELVIDNAPVTISIKDALNTLDDDSVMFTEPTKRYDDNGSVTGATHGEIAFVRNNVDTNERPIKVYREGLPKFQIEDFTTKLHIRSINKTEKLLEFYISKYPDEDRRTTRLLISDIKKAIENPRAANMLNIKEVGFITFKTIGVRDFLEYQYSITSFDKIVEHKGNYIIKFKADILVNGDDILEKYRNEELDVKYEKKERRKKK